MPKKHKDMNKNPIDMLYTAAMGILIGGVVLFLFSVLLRIAIWLSIYAANQS